MNQEREWKDFNWWQKICAGAVIIAIVIAVLGIMLGVYALGAMAVKLGWNAI